VLGRLPDRVSIAGFKVAGFAARLTEDQPYTPQLSEVSEVFELPFAGFLEPERWSYRKTTHPLARFNNVPVFDYGERRVWGLTGIILRDFVRMVSGVDPTEHLGE